MARHRKVRPRRGSNRTVILAQLIGLVIILATILLFRDRFANTTSAVLSGFDSADIQVEETNDGAKTGGERDTPAANPAPQ